MNKAEFLVKKKKLKLKYDNALAILSKDFITSNTIVEIGDIIKDHIGFVKCEQITVGYGFSTDFPVGVFTGPCYTKAGKPFKSGETRSVWGDNIEKD